MFQGNEESKVCNRTFPPLPPLLGSEVGQQGTCLHLTTDTVGQFITCVMLDTSHVELYNPHGKTETPPTVKKKKKKTIELTQTLYLLVQYILPHGYLLVSCGGGGGG